MSEQDETLLWLIWKIDMALGFGAWPLRAPCSACGHGREAHTVNGDADDPTPWPCTYPQSLGAPHRLCQCADYLPMEAEFDER